MKIASILRIALFALRRNKSRSLLTGLGVIIGVMSVIAMLSLGEGAQHQVQAEIASLGTNMLVVTAGSQRSGGLRGAMGTETSLTTDDASAIARDCLSVAAASPGVGLPVTVVAANQNWTTRADGVGEPYLLIRNWSVKSGEFFSAADIRTSARVAVIGTTVASHVFPNDEPLGQTIRIRNLAFRVIGVLAEKGQTGFGQDQDDIVLMPYTTAMKKLLSTTHVSAIFVSARNAGATGRAQTEIQDLLRQRHNPRAGQEDDFTVQNLTDLAKAADKATSTLTLLLGGIAGVSLLVGGIGIMNIMLVSVTERTREIGLRMAVGAKARQVRLQFLAESVVLGLAGGIAGIALGAALCVGLAAYFGWPRFVSVSAVLESVLFSFLVGVFFGYYPARKAAALNPIEALRYE